MVYPGLQVIIDHLKKIDNSEKSLLGFDMNLSHQSALSTDHPCGSACCIGGHAAMLLKRPEMLIGDALAKLCSIPRSVATKLCWPDCGHPGYYAPLEDAVEMLEHCRDTGETLWHTEDEDDD